RVPGGQQQLGLVGLQHSHGLVAARPPDKATLRQPFLRQPEPLPVIDQDADRRPPPTAEDKQTTRERIGLQFLLAQLGERIDALSSIHGFDRHQNAHLGRDLDHSLPSHTIRLSPTNSAIAMPLIWIRILRPAPSNSTTHSGMWTAGGAISSTNAGNSAAFRSGLADGTSFLS